MKWTVDTNKIMTQVRGNFQKHNATINNKIRESREEKHLSQYDDLRDEIDYVKLILAWNKQRLDSGQRVYSPGKLSKVSEKMLKDGIEIIERSNNKNNEIQSENNK